LRLGVILTNNERARRDIGLVCAQLDKDSRGIYVACTFSCRNFSCQSNYDKSGNHSAVVLTGENLGYKRMGLSAILVFVGGGLTWLALYLKRGNRWRGCGRLDYDLVRRWTISIYRSKLRPMVRDG